MLSLLAQFACVAFVTQTSDKDRLGSSYHPSHPKEYFLLHDFSKGLREGSY